jgi:polyhydroxybutyrate depolymerase
MISSHHLTAGLAVLVVLGSACSSSSDNPGGTSDVSGSGSGGASSGGGSNASGGAGGQTSTSQTGGGVGVGGTSGPGGSSAAGGQTSTSQTGGGVGAGGTSGSGGSSAAGGQTSTSQTGGGVGAGGTSGSGGVSAAGGQQNSGGSSAAGGITGAGGSPVSGGTSAAGGAEVQGTGGNAGTGGGAGVHSGGDSSVGGGNAGGRSGASAGCVAGKTTSSCSRSGGTKCTLTSNSKTREYYLILPANYDPSTPYPVVVELHGMIATAEMALSWFQDIPTNMPEAIYIAPQGLKHKEEGGGAGGQEVTGWANVDGEDIQFMKDLVGAAGNDYCVDNTRVFAVGFSYGAMFSYAIGCELGGIFRAIAPMSGALLSGCNLSGKPVAMWGSHGTSDSLVPIDSGREARDKILEQNHCGAETSPIDPSPCVSYQDCDEGYPVTWCEWDGDHNRPPFGSAAVAAFFKQF